MPIDRPEYIFRCAHGLPYMMVCPTYTFALPACLPYIWNCPTNDGLPYFIFALRNFRGESGSYKSNIWWFALFMECPTSTGLPYMMICPPAYLPYGIFGPKVVVTNLRFDDLPYLWYALHLLVCPTWWFALHEGCPTFTGLPYMIICPTWWMPYNSYMLWIDSMKY